MEESINSYSAELEILDFAICKAKAMEVSQPDESPTVVQIDFEGATGWVALTSAVIIKHHYVMSMLRCYEIRNSLSFLLIKKDLLITLNY